MSKTTTPTVIAVAFALLLGFAQTSKASNDDFSFNADLPAIDCPDIDFDRDAVDSDDTFASDFSFNINNSDLDIRNFNFDKDAADVTIFDLSTDNNFNPGVADSFDSDRYDYDKYEFDRYDYDDPARSDQSGWDGRRVDFQFTLVDPSDGDVFSELDIDYRFDGDRGTDMDVDIFDADNVDQNAEYVRFDVDTADIEDPDAGDSFTDLVV